VLLSDERTRSSTPPDNRSPESHEPADQIWATAVTSAALEWLETKREDVEYPAPVLAAIGHFEVPEVHPFADYNGRTARLFATAILCREGAINRPLFSPERYYAEDRDGYFAALRAIKQTRTLDAWLTYFVKGLAVESERVAAGVVEVHDDLSYSRCSGRSRGTCSSSPSAPCDRPLRALDGVLPRVEEPAWPGGEVGAASSTRATGVRERQCRPGHDRSGQGAAR
jgi:hypothetical protein